MERTQDRVHWLLHEGDDPQPVAVSERIAIDDDHWRATIERIDVGGGLRVFLTSAEVRRGLTLEPRHQDPENWLVSNISVRGSVRLELSDGPVAEITPERSVLYRPNDRSARFTPQPAQSLRLAGFMVSATRLRSMFGDEMPAIVRAMIEPGGGTSPLLPVQAGGRLRQLAASLFGRNLEGVLRMVFLEGVVLQLLAEQTSDGERPRRRTSAALSRHDRSAIEEARERLIADLRHPPSPSALAGATGMSEKALNAGFRALYGASMFETLRDQRLDHARALLEENAEAPMKSIAFRVGYSHVSNFTRAFTRRFGAPPRRYVRRQRPN